MRLKCSKFKGTKNLKIRTVQNRSGITKEMQLHNFFLTHCVLKVDLRHSVMQQELQKGVN